MSPIIPDQNPEPQTPPAPLSAKRLAEIKSVQLGDWLSGEWKYRHVDGSGDYDDPDRYELFTVDTGLVLVTLPDWAGNLAMWIADAHEAVPELLAEVERVRDELKARTAELEADSALLGALHAAGVDSWEGYDDAVAEAGGR